MVHGTISPKNTIPKKKLEVKSPYLLSDKLMEVEVMRLLRKCTSIIAVIAVLFLDCDRSPSTAKRLLNLIITSKFIP